MNGAALSFTGLEGSFVLEKPQVLWAFALLAACILFRFILDRGYRGRRGLGFFALFASPPIEVAGIEEAGGDSPGPEGGTPDGGSRAKTLRRRFRLSQIFFWLSLGCLIAALSGPRWGLRIVPEYRRGLDVVLALDLSRSMEARDTDVSRLERAAEIGRETVENIGGVRFGAAVSRGRGVLALPLTGDSEAALNFLAAAGASALTGSGTDLEALVDAAATAFSDSFPSRRVIVLLSDGEALSGALNEAVDRAILREITLAAVGIGSDEGAPVPLETGIPVISRRRPELLEKAAVKSGGIYIDGNSAGASRLLRSYLESLAFESGAGGGRTEKKPRWNLFVLAALLFFGASKCCLLARRDRHGEI
ncbi:MAG: VWA domain-containing protein [Treponema sp.]|jgi:Ca-activated chloride channel family protein|nr:VWA domain-containing protein [Treponema sp.]